MDKTFFGLFHLFIKCSGVYSDEELLQLLGIPIKRFAGSIDYNGICKGWNLIGLHKKNISFHNIPFGLKLKMSTGLFGIYREWKDST